MIKEKEQVIYLDPSDTTVELLNIKSARFELINRTTNPAFDGTNNVKISNTIGTLVGSVCSVQVYTRRNEFDEYEALVADGYEVFLATDNNFELGVYADEPYVNETFKVVGPNNKVRATIDVKLELKNSTAATKLYINYFKAI